MKKLSPPLFLPDRLCFFADKKTAAASQPSENPLASFADRALKAYEKLELKEKAESVGDKMVHFMSEAAGEIADEFKKGGLLKKASIVAGAGAVFYTGLRFIRGALDTVFEIGGWIKEKLDIVHGNTLKGILGLVLGASLGSLLYEALGDKLSFTDVLAAWNKDGVTGLGSLLLEKIKDGTLHMAEDSWNAIAEKLGLPKMDELKDDITEGASAALETVTQGYEWAEQHTRFSVIKERLVSFYQTHGLEQPEWLLSLSLDGIAKDLGMKPDKMEDWISYGAMTGGSYLIWKWLGAKGIAINAAVYFLLLKDGKTSFAGEMMGNISSQIDDSKNKLLKQLDKEFPGVSYLLPDALDTFSLENSVDSMIEWAHMHPAEALVAANGLWICRGLIAKALWMAARNGGSFVLNNPGKAVIGAAALGTLWHSRRVFVDKLIAASYDDASSPQAVAMRQWLLEAVGKDPEGKAGLTEKQVPEFYAALLSDPVEKLKEKKYIDKFLKGEFSLAVDGAGAAWLIAEAFSAPVQLTDLAWTSVKTTLQHLVSADNEQGVAIPMLIGGVELIVFGSMANKAIKSHWTVMRSGSGFFHGLLRGALSLVPGTKEWRFVWKSAVQAPFLPGFKMWAAGNVGKIEAEVAKMRDLLRASPPDMDAIRDISSKFPENPMFKDFAEIRRTLSGADFGYKYAEALTDVQKSLNDIRQASIAGNVDGIQKSLDNIEGNLKTYRTHLSGIISRLELMMKGEFKKAFSLAESKTEMKDTPETKPETPKKLILDDLFKGKSTEKLEREAAALLSKKVQKGLSKADEQTLRALNAFLNPEKALGRIEAGSLDMLHRVDKLDDAAKANRLMNMAEEMAAVERGFQSGFLAKVEDIKKAAEAAGKAMDDPDVVRQLTELDDLSKTFARNKAQRIGIIDKFFRQLPTDLRTPALKSSIRNAFGEGLMTRMVKGAKGRMKFAALMASAMFLVEVIRTSTDDEKDMADLLQKMGPEAEQLLLDCMPVAGTYSSFYSTFTGKELMTTNDVSSGWHRTENALWGVAGLAGDIVTVLGLLPSGGAATGANVLVRVTKAADNGSAAAKILLKNWPKIERIAENMGGWYEFGKKVVRHIGKSEDVVRTLRKVDRTATGAGLAMLGGGLVHVGYRLVTDSPEIDMSVYK